MELHETPRSLKLYLIVVGTMGLGSAVLRLANGANGTAAAIALGQATFSVAYLVLGVRIRTILVKSPAIAFRTFYATFAWHGVNLVTQATLGNGWMALSGESISVLLTWYLLANARRIAADPVAAGL